MSEIFKELKAIEDRELPKELFTKDNIELKTELPNPLSVTTIEVIGEHFKDLDDGIPDILNTFVKHYKVNMVSNQRKSRQEFVKAIVQTLQLSEEQIKEFNKFLKV